MQTKDHFALGQFLLKHLESEELQKHKYSFLIGCVEPDFNILTYTRGMKKHSKFRGHNAENSKAYITKCLLDIQQAGLQTAWDYFSLGTMIHYAADAFTWPHNEFWEGNLIQHRIYEAKLHEIFSQVLTSENAETQIAGESSLQRFFEGSHAMYHATEHNIATDCCYIINVCETMMKGCLQYIANEKKILEDMSYYESVLHHSFI